VILYWSVKIPYSFEPFRHTGSTFFRQYNNERFVFSIYRLLVFWGLLVSKVCPWPVMRKALNHQNKPWVDESSRSHGENKPGCGIAHSLFFGGSKRRRLM
jgi:hypothetical protein